MKKIFSLIAAALCFLGAQAQYDYSNANRLDSLETAMANANARLAEMRADSLSRSAWGGTKYFNIGYSVASTGNGNYAAQKASYGVFLNLGNEFLWPKKAVAGMLKFGLDLRWLDLQFAGYGKYNRYVSNPNGVTGTTNAYHNGGIISDMTPSTGDNTDARYYEISQMQLLAGIVGFGPTITFAPFAQKESAANSLKLNIYFHYQPTAGLTFYSSKPINGNYDMYDEQDIEVGYVSMFDFGGRIQWKKIGIGIEGRWGSGKFKDTYLNTSGNTVIGDVTYDHIAINGSKGYDKSYTRKFAETRIFFDVTF